MKYILKIRFLSFQSYKYFFNINNLEHIFVTPTLEINKF